MRLRITSKGVFCISEETTSQKNIEKSSDAKVMVKHECVPAAAKYSSKRKAQTSIDGQTCKKRPKMDPNGKLHCTRVLKELMISHPRLGHIFDKQVDPVLKMKTDPDYSSKNTNPMNLGSIRCKLQGNMYFNVDAGFSGDDVRLTFSNAATYNRPPEHPVDHKVAKHLEGTFSKSRKKVMETQLMMKKGNTTVKHACSFMRKGVGHYVNQTVDEKKYCPKTKLKNGNNTVKHACSFMDDMRKGGHYVNQTVDEKKYCPKTKPFGITSRRVSSKEQNHQKTKQVGSLNNKDSNRVQLGTENRCPNARAFANHDRPTHDISADSSTEPKCGSCGSLICHCCHFKKGSPQTSLNVQMSPKKAMRAAMLKARFADTIFKATQKITIKSDTAARMHQERERLESEQNDPKMLQRQREREAARMALQKMKRTVYIDENLVILKDLEEMLYGKALGHGRGALEQFGLYVKDDNYSEENEDRILNAEEGEIIEF